MNQVDSKAILFVNSNPSFLMHIGILVKRLGYKVYLVLDRLEALHVARQRKPAVMVIDYSLFKIDSKSFVDAIRNETELREIPIIMLGSDDNTLSEIEIEQINIQGYLKKPLNVTDFYLSIQKCVHRSTRRRHVRAPLTITVSTHFNGQQKELQASNLSVEGIFLKTSDPYPAATEMDLVLTVDDEDPIELKGVVVSAHRTANDNRPESGMGIKFVNIPEDVRCRLHYVVMNVLTQDIPASDTGETLLDEVLYSD